MTTEIVDKEMYEAPDIPEPELAEGYDGVDPTAPPESEPKPVQPIAPVEVELPVDGEPVAPVGDPEPSDQEGADGEPETPVDAPASVSVELIQRAGALGMDVNMLTMLGDGLETAVTNAEHMGYYMPQPVAQQSVAQPEPEPAYTAPELKVDLEQFDEQTRGVVEQLVTHVNTVTQGMGEKIHTLERSNQRLQESSEIDDIRTGDAAITELNDPALYGMGPVHQLNPRSKAYGNRASVLRYANGLRADYAANGITLPWPDAVSAAHATNKVLSQRNGSGPAPDRSTNDATGVEKGATPSTSHRPSPRTRKQRKPQTEAEMLKDARDKTARKFSMPAHVVDS